MREVIRDVSVGSESLIFRAGRILPQSFVASLWYEPWCRPGQYSRFLFKNYLVRRRTPAIPSALWVIDNLTEANYHHWLIDALPRIVHAEELFPEVPVLLLPEHYQRQRYVQFTLKAFPRWRIRWIGSRERVLVRELSFVPYSPPLRIGGPPAYRRDLLQRVATSVGALAEPQSSGRRLYFSRDTAERRRARNEREVVRVLETFGVERISLDGSWPSEQVEMSRAADLIVGVHGAALSNALFMPSGGALIELTRREREDIYLPANYRVLAETMGHRYVPVRCDLAEPAEGWESNHADLSVDLDALREALQLATSRL